VPNVGRVAPKRMAVGDMSPRFASPSELYCVSRMPRGAIERWPLPDHLRVSAELGLEPMNSVLVRKPGRVRNWFRGAPRARLSLRCVRLRHEQAPRVLEPPFWRARPPPPDRACCEAATAGEPDEQRDGEDPRHRDHDQRDEDRRRIFDRSAQPGPGTRQRPSRPAGSDLRP
jgi:hypothetical protein